MRIGHLNLSGDAVLAPMAGITDAVFRWLCREQGAPLTMTEMVSAKGYLCAPGQRAQQALLHCLPGDAPVGLQIFGADPAELAEAARRILAEHKFCLVDINMGCPAHKIIGGGAGSALMKEPRLAARIIEMVASSVAVPVTVKMRAGWDDGHKNAVELARLAERSGAAAVTVHGRTRQQQYAGQADWEIIAAVKQAVRIPVIGNGDVFTAPDAAALRARTGCDGVMIGRGALGNPWLFDDLRRQAAGLPPQPRSVAEKMALAARHVRLMVAWQGERHGVPEMRKHLAWYVKGLPGAAQLRVAVNRAQSEAELLACLAGLVAGAPAENARSL